jgi:hypothetical protein
MFVAPPTGIDMNPTTTNPPPFPWPGPDFERNREQLPAAERDRWAGQHVAWSWDGTRIVAGADTLPNLLAELRKLHVDPATVVFDFLDTSTASA